MIPALLFFGLLYFAARDKGGASRELLALIGILIVAAVIFGVNDTSWIDDGPWAK